MLYHLISEDFIHALGWTVVHSLWQGILIALIMMLVLFFLQKKSSNTRYWVANLALVAVLMTSIWTFFSLFEQQNLVNDEGFLLLFNQETAAFLTETGQLSFVEYYSQQFTNYFNEHLPLIVLIWGIGVAFFVLRLFGGLFYIQYLKYNFNTPLDDFWQEKLQVLQDKIPVEKTVALMESALIKVPMVMGYFKPMILLPIGIVNVLDSEQIEAILAHELAHISRNDFLLNILQSVVEVLFYFNPAVWWISANIRMERENCCDDIAVSICGDSLIYAKALVSIQEMNQAAPSFAMTFSGGRQKNQLLNRVKRILHQPQNKSNIMEKFMATCLLLVAFVAWSLQANSSTILEGNNTAAFQQNIETTPLLETVIVTGDEDEIHIETIFVKQDTIPKGKRHFHHNKGKQDVEMQLDGDEIVKLKVNGKTIPKENMEEYDDLVTELMEDLDNMKVPTPPNPPVPPVAPFAPAGLEDMLIPAPPMPPSPPVPPSPSFFRLKSTSNVIQKEDENGNTYYIVEDETEDEPVIFEMESDDEHFLLKSDLLALSDFDFKIDNSLENGLHLFESDIMDNNILFLDTFPHQNLSEEEQSARKKAHKARKEIHKEMALLREEQRELAATYRQEMSVKMKVLREKERAIQQELRTEHKERMIEQRELHLERSNAMRDDMKVRSKKMRIQAKERRKTTHKTTGDLRELFEQQLIADGIINKKGDAYKLELSGDKLTIDGKKQNTATLEKYKMLYKSSADTTLKDDDSISIRVKSNGSVSVSIQIEEEN